jgi:hypothetical protein
LPIYKSQNQTVAAAGPVAVERSPSKLEEFIAASAVWLQNLVFDSKTLFDCAFGKLCSVGGTGYAVWNKNT